MDAIEHENASPSDERAQLRTRLKAARRDFLVAQGEAATEGLARQLRPLLQQLEPLCLGLYWPLPGEFDVLQLLASQPGAGVFFALPFAQRDGQMHYRYWQPGTLPAVLDERGIPSSAGERADPDLVLVPCLGFDRNGYRLGYGGGYFDRWQAAHPGVTTVGLAWSVCEAQWTVAAHDQALGVILTERELFAA